MIAKIVDRGQCSTRRQLVYRSIAYAGRVAAGAGGSVEISVESLHRGSGIRPVGLTEVDYVTEGLRGRGDGEHKAGKNDGEGVQPRLAMFHENPPDRRLLDEGISRLKKEQVQSTHYQVWPTQGKEP
jgi:hypothetical protein